MTEPVSQADEATPVAAPNPLEGPEAEATLLELEDRRAFDEAALRSLCAGPEATRARAALALGRIGDERVVGAADERGAGEARRGTPARPRPGARGSGW